jgi:hypothetical protein
VTLANNGKSAISLGGVAVAGDFAETTTCGTSLAAAGHCTVIVTFTPKAAGTRTGTLTFNLSTGSQTVALTGTGASGSQPSALTISPAAVNFTGYIVGDNPSQTVTVTNKNGITVGLAGLLFSANPALTETQQLRICIDAGGKLRDSGDVHSGDSRHVHRQSDHSRESRRAGQHPVERHCGDFRQLSPDSIFKDHSPAEQLGNARRCDARTNRKRPSSSHSIPPYTLTGGATRLIELKPHVQLAEAKPCGAHSAKSEERQR